MYLLGRDENTRSGLYYIHSSDRGKSFDYYKVPARENLKARFDIEQFSGHNIPQNPPPFLRYVNKGKEDDWLWIFDLELYVPRKEKGKIVIGEPILLSENCIGRSHHSGTPSTIVSRNGKIHIIWGEATDDDVPGAPTYVATYSHENGDLLGNPVLIGYGAPKNDIHNTPSMVIDSKGYLHALPGTHGRPFRYVKSQEPNTTHQGWTDPVSVGDRQTYIGLVIDQKDTLHLVYREWGGPYHAYLAYQRKKSGREWEDIKSLVLPAFYDYSVYWHRLTIDREGQLYLSYSYWPVFWFYRNDQMKGGYGQRSVLTSPDNGDTWKFWDGDTNIIKTPH